MVEVNDNNPDNPLQGKLLALSADILRARATLEELVAKRDELIRQVSDSGLTRREVAQLAGVTVGRVQQVIDRPSIHVQADGDEWAAKNVSAGETITAPTKKEAIRAARQMAQQRGAELVIHDREGRIVDRLTYPRTMTVTTTETRKPPAEAGGIPERDS